VKLRELFEAPGKTAVVAFGRMNPPTIGHAKLVDKIKSIPGDHLLFLSQTQNAKDNPLSFDQKVRFAKASFQGIEIGNKDVRTPIDMMQKLEGLGYTDIVYVAGSDRVSSFEKLFPKYNGTDYDFNSIEVVSAGERDPDAEGAEGMSASKMRKAAIEGNFEAFQQGVANPRIAKEMYDAIRQAMGIQDEGLDNALGGSVDEGDVIPFKKSNPANPRLDKDAIDAWNKERNQKMAQDMIKLAPEVVEYYKELKDQNKDTETAIDIIAYDFDIDKYNVKRILQANNIDEDVNEFNLFKGADNSSVKEQDPNKMKVLDWIADRVDGKEHFLSFYRKGAAWSGRLLFIKPDEAKRFMQKVEANPDHLNRIKKALTSIETTSKLFTNLKIKHDIRRAE